MAHFRRSSVSGQVANGVLSVALVEKVEGEASTFQAWRPESAESAETIVEDHGSKQ
jgi:hypothetical protein